MDNLPFELLAIIFDYLDLSDVISMDLSGVSVNFRKFVDRLTKLDFSSNFLSDAIGQQMISHFVCHCPNLYHLNISNLNVDLLGLTCIFERAKSLQRLSFTLRSEVFVALPPLPSTVAEGLASLSRLELKVILTPTRHISLQWLWIIEMLSHCQCCDHLEISVDELAGESVTNPQESLLIPLDARDRHIYIDYLLAPLISWMKNLKQLIVIASNDNPFRNGSNRPLDDIINWVLNCLKPTNLTVLWLEMDNVVLESLTSAKLKKLSAGLNLCSIKQFEHISDITHLGNGFLTTPHVVFPNLKFFHGICHSYSVLVDFLKRHQTLKHLIVDFMNSECGSSSNSDEDVPLMACLETLVLKSLPCTIQLHAIIGMAPNLHHLEVGSGEERFLSHIEVEKIVQLKKLKILNFICVSFAGGDLSLFTKILKASKSLESLELTHFDARFMIGKCIQLSTIGNQLLHLRLVFPDLYAVPEAIEIVGSNCHQLKEFFFGSFLFPDEETEYFWHCDLDGIPSAVLHQLGLLFSCSKHLSIVCFTRECDLSVAENDDFYLFVREHWRKFRPDLWRLASLKLFSGQANQSFAYSVSELPRRRIPIKMMCMSLSQPHPTIAKFPCFSH